MDQHATQDGTSRRAALKLFGAGLATVGLGASSGLAQSDTESTTDATVTFDDQSPHYRTVTVAEVTLPDDGFVVLHDASFFTEGPVLGVSPPLSAGTYRNLPVQFDEVPDGPLTVAAIPHQDTPADGEFTYPDDGDAPYVGEDGAVYDLAEIRPE